MLLATNEFIFTKQKHSHNFFCLASIMSPMDFVDVTHEWQFHLIRFYDLKMQTLTSHYTLGTPGQRVISCQWNTLGSVDAPAMECLVTERARPLFRKKLMHPGRSQSQEDVLLMTIFEEWDTVIEFSYLHPISIFFQRGVVGIQHECGCKQMPQ